MSGAALESRPVRSRRDWRDFHAVRRAVYRGDPADAPPLASEQRLLLDERRHPFWQHAEREVFLCRERGRAVGRVAAIVDRLHQEHYAEPPGDRAGFFGFFETPDRADVADRLLAAAADWLRARGCDRMRGPASPSLKGEFGAQVTGHDAPSAVMMAHTPAYYDRLLRDAGMVPVHEFFAFELSRREVLDRGPHWKILERLSARSLARNPELRVARGTRASLAAELQEINELANRVRVPVWGFVPFTRAEIDFLVRRLSRVLVPDLVSTVRLRGELVGYLLAVPDANWALARARGGWDVVRLAQLPFLLPKIPRLRVLALGADARYRAAGITALLFREMFEAALPRYETFEFSWISEANVASLRALLRILPMTPARSYRLYEAPLANWPGREGKAQEEEF